MPRLNRSVLLAAELCAGFVLSARCPLCGSASKSGSQPFCSGCEAGFSPADDYAPDWAIPADRAVYYDGTVSLYRYDAVLRRVVSALKSGDHPEIAGCLGRMAAERLRNYPRPGLVTFVPVSSRRRRERGYNQAELIARSLGRSLGIPVKAVLNVSGEGNQKRMHYHERFLNMVGRFSCRERFSPGTSVLLVDDVFTTGATVNECARVLKKMGASPVFSLTIARVDDKKVSVVGS